MNAPLPPEPTPSRRLITTRREYQGAVTSLIDEAYMTLHVFDADGRDLELNSRDRIERLAAFLQRFPQAKLAIVVHTIEHLERQCPRLIELLRRHGAQISILRTEGEAVRAQDAFVIADDRHLVRRPVHAQPRGVYLRDDAPEAQRMRERFDQILESSTIALTATTLGL